MITCQFENNGKASLRHAVVNLLVLKNNQILLVKRAPSIPEPNKWGLVGGFIGRDETIKGAGGRESLEETGYKVELKELFLIVDNPKTPREDRQNISFVYLAEALEKVGEADWESTEVKWFDLDKLPPEKDFAFDHYEMIKHYLKFQKSRFNLPIFVSG